VQGRWPNPLSYHPSISGLCSMPAACRCNAKAINMRQTSTYGHSASAGGMLTQLIAKCTQHWTTIQPGDTKRKSLSVVAVNKVPLTTKASMQKLSVYEWGACKPPPMPTYCQNDAAAAATSTRLQQFTPTYCCTRPQISCLHSAAVLLGSMPQPAQPQLTAVAAAAEFAASL
jgi:hypothetical protein